MLIEEILLSHLHGENSISLVLQSPRLLWIYSSNETGVNKLEINRVSFEGKIYARQKLVSFYKSKISLILREINLDGLSM